MPEPFPFSDTVVIFDLDGTLVDSAPDLAAAMNVVLQSEGYGPLPAAEVRQLVGHGARALLVDGFAAHGITDLPEQQLQTHVDQFIDYYKIHLADQSRPFSGCTRTLAQLKKSGASLAVCTNKSEELTYPLLQALDLEGCFDCIICRDTLPVCKPDPAPLLCCLRRTGMHRGIMIGDTITDLNAALAAEMPCLIATFGYGSFDEADIKKARQFQKFEELPSLISEILAVA